MCRSPQITISLKETSNNWFTSCRASNAMIFFSTPFRGQQVLTPLGSEQTTSLLVVMISLPQTTNTLFRLWRNAGSFASAAPP